MAPLCENSVEIKKPAKVLTIKLNTSGIVKNVKAFISLNPTLSNSVPDISHQSVKMRQCSNALNPVMLAINTQNVLFRNNLYVSAFIRLVMLYTSYKL